MQMYNRTSLITLHVINNLLVQRWLSMFSERAVYTELEFCYKLKRIFISIECDMGSKLLVHIKPHPPPFHDIISIQKANC